MIIFGRISFACALERVVIDRLGLLAHAVVDDAVEAAGEIHLVAVREVAAVREVHGQDQVAGLEHGEINGGIGLRTGVRLHVDVLGAEKLLRALDGQFLDDVDVFAAAVPALLRDNPRRTCWSGTSPALPSRRGW